MKLRWIDWGGGFLPPPGPDVPNKDAFRQAAEPILASLASTHRGIAGSADVKMVVEPGRFLVGHAAAIHATCVDVIPGVAGKKAAVLDASVGILSGYDSWRGTARLSNPIHAPLVEALYDVVGPSGMEDDVLGRFLFHRDPEVFIEILKSARESC